MACKFSFDGKCQQISDFNCNGIPSIHCDLNTDNNCKLVVDCK